jgi:hypothetical protein
VCVQAHTLNIHALGGGGGLLPLFLLLLNHLEPVEFLPLTLIELRHDVLDGVVNAGQHHVFDGVHTTIGDLDHFVQRHEGRL